MTTLSAHEIISAVQSGSLSPVTVVKDALQRIEENAALGALQEVFADEALTAATALEKRKDLAKLPLAGLPILIKDTIPVAGHPMRVGSQATSNSPSRHDHEVVRRLRDAGAIILGLTTVPELCVFATTDSPAETTRNPWNPDRTPGGSSGGTGAAVAAGIVPVAHGTDGMGSIRIPAANNGVFGIKPGLGTVPAGLGGDSWGGMAENGPLATTVADAALVLSVMAGTPELAIVTEPAAPLRIGVVPATTSFLVRLDPEWKKSLLATADALREAGHNVEVTKFPYPANPIPMFARWFAGVAKDAEGLDEVKLQRRTLRHVKLGKRALKKGWVKKRDTDRLEADARAFFADHDILLTPMLARSAPKAEQWHRRSWLRNIWSNLQYAPFAAPWNMVGWPAASVPAGFDANTGMPTAVQIVAPPNGESLILGLAVQIERLRPWPRTAPQPT
ncbi:MAG: amidase [Microbacteriaceae bacterium]|nr:amidase [Microbacteriaceae bacterium]